MTNGGYPQGPAGQPAAPAQPGMPGFFPPEDIEQGKTWALLGYLIGPLWIVPLVQRDNAFALFHAKQAMVYTIIMMIASIPVAVIGALTCGIGTILIFPLMYPWIMAVVYSAQGQYRPMPWFGHYAERYFSQIVPDKRPGGYPGAFSSPYRGYPGAPPR